jgi:chromosomal replication initiator protein
MEFNPQQLWQAVLGELELTLSKANFSTWFKGTFISSIEGDKVVIGVPSSFILEWLEKKYKKAILQAVQNITQGKIKEINFRIGMPKKPSTGELLKKPTREKIPGSLPSEEKTNHHGLNPRYTFSTFIVGKGNELAHAAAQAVVANPGKTYNPLFIYGGVGLGKTHLIQAIGHAIIEKYPEKKIIYTTCEKFMNDFINSISSGGQFSNQGEFKNKYRSIDVLLVDDIQFLSGKEGTQEQFFHAFNDLHQNNKQIVLTSDRPPKAIPALENRLLTRFEWGMIADISEPDLETRIAILKAKCKEKNYELDPQIINYIATSVQSNIRELEGALNRIIAYHQLNNAAPTFEEAKKTLSSITSSYSGQRKAVTPKQLINLVASFYDIPISDIVGKCREKKLVTPRQIIMYLMRKELKSSYPAIGQELGGRDHTTAIHAYKKISRDFENDEKIRQEIEQIKQRLYS